MLFNFFSFSLVTPKQLAVITAISSLSLYLLNPLLQISLLSYSGVGLILVSNFLLSRIVEKTRTINNVIKHEKHVSVEVSADTIDEIALLLDLTKRSYASLKFSFTYCNSSKEAVGYAKRLLEIIKSKDIKIEELELDFGNFSYRDYELTLLHFPGKRITTFGGQIIRGDIVDKDYVINTIKRAFVRSIDEEDGFIEYTGDDQIRRRLDEFYLNKYNRASTIQNILKIFYYGNKAAYFESTPVYTMTALKNKYSPASQSERNLMFMFSSFAVSSIIFIPLIYLLHNSVELYFKDKIKIALAHVLLTLVDASIVLVSFVASLLASFQGVGFFDICIKYLGKQDPTLNFDVTESNYKSIASLLKAKRQLGFATLNFNIENKSKLLSAFNHIMDEIRENKINIENLNINIYGIKPVETPPSPGSDLIVLSLGRSYMPGVSQSDSDVDRSAVDSNSAYERNFALNAAEYTSVQHVNVGITSKQKSSSILKCLGCARKFFTPKYIRSEEGSSYSSPGSNYNNQEDNLKLIFSR